MKLLYKRNLNVFVAFELLISIVGANAALKLHRNRAEIKIALLNSTISDPLHAYGTPYNRHDCELNHKI